MQQEADGGVDGVGVWTGGGGSDQGRDDALSVWGGEESVSTAKELKRVRVSRAKGCIGVCYWVKRALGRRVAYGG